MRSKYRPPSLVTNGNPVCEDRPWFHGAVQVGQLVLSRGDRVYWRENGLRYAARVAAASPQMGWPDCRPAVARLLLAAGDVVLAFADELEVVDRRGAS